MFNNMAIVYNTRGQLEKAQEFYEQHLAIRLKAQGTEHSRATCSTT